MFVPILEHVHCPGSKLRELMLQNGCDFSLVEVQLQRWSQSTMGQKRSGQWVTKHSLLTTHNWTKRRPQFCPLVFYWFHAMRNNMIKHNYHLAVL